MGGWVDGWMDGKVVLTDCSPQSNKFNQYQVVLTSFMTLFQVFKFVCIATAALVKKTLTTFCLHVEVEHWLEGAASTGIFGKFAQVITTTQNTTH